MWLEWWAHQLDTSHWWSELTTITNVEDPRKLAQKLCASFLILEVRCEALPGQDCTMPLPPNVSLGIGSSLMILPIRMSNGSPCY